MRKRNRQKKVPKEFQINSTPGNYKVLVTNPLAMSNNPRVMLNNMQAMTKKTQAKPQKPPEQKAEKQEVISIKDITDIIIYAWRMYNKSESLKENSNVEDIKELVSKNEDISQEDAQLIRETLDDSLKPIKYMNRQSKKILKIFEEKGFEVKDHTNTKYHGGMAINVLAFETNENFTENIITETIKPSIFYNNQLIMYGEVIVTTPKDQ